MSGVDTRSVWQAGEHYDSDTLPNKTIEYCFVRGTIGRSPKPTGVDKASRGTSDARVEQLSTETLSFSLQLRALPFNASVDF